MHPLPQLSKHYVNKDKRMYNKNLWGGLLQFILFPSVPVNFSKINNLINSKAFDFWLFMLSFILHLWDCRTKCLSKSRNHIFDLKQCGRGCSPQRVTKAQIGVWPLLPVRTAGCFPSLGLSFNQMVMSVNLVKFSEIV